MIHALLALVYVFTYAFRHRQSLALENLALRQQLAVYQRRHSCAVCIYIAGDRLLAKSIDIEVVTVNNFALIDMFDLIRQLLRRHAPLQLVIENQQARPRLRCDHGQFLG
jgi:hypothetical protein